jgi:hypothetical protein
MIINMLMPDDKSAVEVKYYCDCMVAGLDVTSIVTLGGSSYFEKKLVSG